VDYGHEAAELYNNRHMRGTLLAYQQHRASEDFFAAPGEQDLTAHVNFTALDLAGRRMGLARAGLVSQSHFLLALGRANDFADLYDTGQSETDRLRARLLLKNLIHPEGFGETFRVLLQHKGFLRRPAFLDCPLLALTPAPRDGVIPSPGALGRDEESLFLYPCGCFQLGLRFMGWPTVAPFLLCRVP